MRVLSVLVPLSGLLVAYLEYSGVASFSTALRTVIYGGIFTLTVFIHYLQSSSEEWRGGGTSGIFTTKEHAEHMEKKGSQVGSAVESYEANFGAKSRSGDKEHEALLAKRQKNYMEMVNHFYDLVTDFYEYGWGDCFHFGPRFTAETHMESLRRAEYFLSTRLGLKTGQSAADVGCGVGGPMRNIARFSGANIVGINNNEYQIKVGTKYNQKLGLDKQCSFIKSDFMNMPVKENTFDAAYAIEATCHSPDKTKCFGEVFRVVKSGGYFACYEWVVLDSFDKNNKKHVSLKEGIEVGNGLPELATIVEVVAALKNSGWEVIEHYDANRNAHKVDNIPWYQPLAGEWSVGGFRKTPLGRFFTHIFVSTLETLRVAPKGSTKVSAILNATADDLAESGKLEIFTPSYYFLARKPLNA